MKIFLVIESRYEFAAHKIICQISKILNQIL